MTKEKNSDQNSWISVQHIQHLVSKAEQAGLDSSELLATMKMNAKQLDNPEAQISLLSFENLLENLVERFPDVPLGLQLVSGSQPASFGVLGYLSQASANVADALNALEKYNGLLSNVGKVSVLHKPGFVCVQWACKSDNPLFHRHASEYIIASLVLLMRSVLPKQKNVIHAVNFSHALPKNISMLALYHRFFQCPVYFNEAFSQVIIQTNFLKHSLRYSDVLMRKTLEQHADALMNKRREGSSVRVDVENLIEAMLGDCLPNKEMVAQQLGFSGRSLHRKLAEEDTSFQMLLDELRLVRAQNLLRKTDLSLEKIADELSFQSRQSFIRWFKTQTQSTPGQFRLNNSENKQ